MSLVNNYRVWSDSYWRFYIHTYIHTHIHIYIHTYLKSRCVSREFDPKFFIHSLGIGLYKEHQLLNNGKRKRAHKSNIVRIISNMTRSSHRKVKCVRFLIACKKLRTNIFQLKYGNFNSAICRRIFTI